MKRLEWLDSIKGFAIILVVLGHVIDGYISANLFTDEYGIECAVYNICYSFHMPLFFAISGVAFAVAYILPQGGYKYDRIKRQITNVVLLYIEWSIILWSCKMLFASDVNNPVSVSTLLEIPVTAISPYWYLYVLACCYLLFLLPQKWITNWVTLCFAFLLGIGSFWIMNSQLRGYTITHTLVYFFFFLAGVQLIRNQVRVKLGYSLVILFIGVFIGLLTSYCEPEKIQWWSNPIWGWIISLTVGGSLLMIFQNVRERALGYIGRHCLEIYVIHCILTAFNRKFLFLLGIDNFFVNVVLNTALSVLISVVISEMLKRIGVYNILFKPVEVLSVFRSKSN